MISLNIFATPWKNPLFQPIVSPTIVGLNSLQTFFSAFEASDRFSIKKAVKVGLKKLVIRFFSLNHEEMYIS